MNSIHSAVSLPGTGCVYKKPKMNAPPNVPVLHRKEARAGKVEKVEKAIVVLRTRGPDAMIRCARAVSAPPAGPAAL